jgi:Family of unknown function (DUF5641)
MKRQKWQKQDNKEPTLGEVVFMMDEATKPFEWPVAKITKLNKSVDGMTTSAEVILVIQKGNFAATMEIDSTSYFRFSGEEKTHVKGV